MFHNGDNYPPPPYTQSNGIIYAINLLFRLLGKISLIREPQNWFVLTKPLMHQVTFLLRYNAVYLHDNTIVVIS